MIIRQTLTAKILEIYKTVVNIYNKYKTITRHKTF